MCVIAVGTDAVNNIRDAESYGSFADWVPGTGYINAAGSDAYASYSMANTAAQDATSAGW